MQILYGTGNPAKLGAMRNALKDMEVEIVGLSDISIKVDSIDESGNNPLENATIKARAYHKATRMPVFSCDSGLYIQGLDDKRQPGVHVRNVNGRCLTDDEMIEYYSSLAREMGGQMIGRYINAICLIWEDGRAFEYMGEDISTGEFIITYKAHFKRIDGFPLDSLSIHIPTGKYYYDMQHYGYDNLTVDHGFRKFFANALSL